MQASTEINDQKMDLPPNEHEIFDEEDLGEIDKLVNEIGPVKQPEQSAGAKLESNTDTTIQTNNARSNKNKMNGEQQIETNKTNGNGGNEKTIKITLNVKEKDWTLLQILADAQNKGDAAEMVQEVVGKMSDGAREKMMTSLSSFDFFQKPQTPSRRN